MAVLKQIKFGESISKIQFTEVKPANGGVITATPSHTDSADENNPEYAIDLTIANDGTLVKENNALKVGTVPATQVSVATGTGLTATNAQAAFKELKDDIKKVISDGKTYSIVDDTKNDKSLPANVLKRYRLQETVGSTNKLLGEPIDILKDNSLLAAKLSTMDATWADSAIVDGNEADALVLVYKDANGEAQVIHIDVSAFLKDAEFKDGLQVNGGMVSVKLGQGLEFGGETGENQSIKVNIDSTSESFLTVGDDGVKLAGIQAAIDAKVAALDVTDAAVEGQYVSQVSETDGKIAVSRLNVSDAKLNGYAKGIAPTAGSEAVTAGDDVKGAIAKLEHQVDAAKAATTSAIKALNKEDTANEGQVVTAVSTADGIAQPAKADFAGIKLGGFTQDTDATGEIASTDTLAAALNKLENKIDAAADDHTVVKNATINTHVIVSGTQNGNGSTTYTVTENDIASAQALTNEIKRAQDAEKEIADKVGLTGDESKRTFTPTTNYGDGSTSVVGNMQKLDTKLREVADGLAAVQYKVNGTTLEFYGMTEHA